MTNPTELTLDIATAGRSRRVARGSLARADVIEVIGLPGAGKTAACRALLAQMADAEQSWVSIPGVKLRKSILPKLLLPITLLRFRRVLRATKNPNARRWPLTRAVVTIFRRRAGKLWRAKNSLVSTLFLLTTTVTEIELARLEARLRRRTLIVDEGFVHRALGVWIRSAPDVRDGVLATYLESIAIGSACLLLRCDPETASARALLRKRGLPPVTRRAVRALDSQNGRAAAISAIYREQSEVFDLQTLRSRVRMTEVDANGTPEEIAEQIETELRQFGLNRPPLIFLRS